MSLGLFLLRSVIVGLISISATTGWAAKPINLRHYSAQRFSLLASTAATTLTKMHADTDANNITHTRFQQTYQGIPVWGADIVKHQPNGKSFSLNRMTMNGIVYQGLANDLTVPATSVFTAVQQQKAIQKAAHLAEENVASQAKAQLDEVQSIIYVDDENKAHWAYQLKFTLTPSEGLPVLPVFIMDATSHTVYETWNDLKTFDIVNGGGFGGNPREGEFVYDSLANDYPELEIRRDAARNICYLQNADVIVKDARHGDEVAHFNCGVLNAAHNNIYWDADFDAINGGYSPSNDALYIGKVVKSMWQDWYHIPVLVQAGKPMPLVMRVHLTNLAGKIMDNAYWANGQVSFGDGSDEHYPLTTLDVASHEIAHGFTEQHSRLTYRRQSGGVNESFSDMAAKATEYYVTHQNTWVIGADVSKGTGQGLRYMDEPTKDCIGLWPGESCSISDADAYRNDMNVHNSSGVFNKVFYLLSTTQGWDTQKAFNVMVQANQYHWTANTSFDDAACDVVLSAHELGYNAFSVAVAFDKVNIDTDAC